MKKDLGLVHIYCGDGKGKTTAAMGLALRGIGNGFKVVILQFLKNGGSSEISALKNFPNVTFFANQQISGASFNMNAEEVLLCKKLHRDHLIKVVELCNTRNCDILILDEVIGAYNKGYVDKAMLLDFLKNPPKGIEIIMTGRNPAKELLELADYISEIKKIKHPFDKGIGGRLGIEK